MTQESTASAGAVLVSVIILVTFGAATLFVVTQPVPAANEAVAYLMTGFLGGMATSVCGYWVGSSNGSHAKDQVIARAQEALANSMPVPPNTEALPPGSSGEK